MDFDDIDNAEDQGQQEEEGGFGGPNFDDFFGGENAQDGDTARHMNDSVIFLVDCRKSMMTIVEDGKSHFDLVIDAIVSFMKTKVITSKDDKMSLILYNVENANNTLKFKGINQVFNLENPDADRIKQVINIPKNFNTTYKASSTDHPLFEALWMCQHTFKEVDKKPFTKRIFLFTDEDNPSANDNNIKTQAFSYAKRLTEMNVDIELFPLKRPDKDRFDIRKFYVDLIAIDPDDASTGVLDTNSSRITELSKRIRQKIYKKRQLGSLDFHLAPGVKIGVRFYAMTHTAKKPTAVNLDSAKNKRLMTASKQICAQTGTALHKDQIGFFYPLADEKVIFKKDDIAEIKKFDIPGMKLMGFKPKSRIKPYHNYRSSYFLYPDEDRITGSSQLCDAMIKQMIAKDKVAIVRFVPRVTSQIRFCALFPQKEDFDEDNFQTPPGFHLIFLPFAEDIRKLENVKPKQRTQTDRTSVINAKLLIRALSVDFDCRNMENPDIQKFYSNLQAIALNEEDPEEVVDLLDPDVEGMSKYENVIDAFKHSVWGDDYTDPAARGGTKKRTTKAADVLGVNTKKPKTSGGGSHRTDMDSKPKRGGKAKKADSDDGADDYDFDDDFIVDDRKKGGKKKGASKKKNDDYDGEWDDIEEWLRQGENKKLKVADLKDYLAAKGLPTGGKKDELIERALNNLLS